MNKEDSNISGKYFLVTGASSGFGKATSILLSNYGAKIVLVGRSKDKLKTSLKSTDLLLAREVKYKNWHSNSYQFSCVSKDQLGEIQSKIMGI